MRKSAVILYFILHILQLRHSYAQTPEVTNGFNYLTSVQSRDGYWSDAATSTVASATISSIGNAVNSLKNSWNANSGWWP